MLPSERQLQVLLEPTGDWEMFRALCMDLLSSSNDASDQAGALQLLVQRLIRWQRLLSKGGGKLLDEREVRGLMGELLFLRDRLLPQAGTTAVDCWQGPEGLPQDFVYAGRLIEVKTYSAGSNPSVRIASAEQLSSGDVPLFLHVVCLVRQEGALCLPALVDEVRSLLSLVLAERLVVLFGRSGMGKSSLINAGLVEPLLQRGAAAQRGPARSWATGRRAFAKSSDR